MTFFKKFERLIFDDQESNNIPSPVVTKSQPINSPNVPAEYVGVLHSEDIKVLEGVLDENNIAGFDYHELLTYFSNLGDWPSAVKAVLTTAEMMNEKDVVVNITKSFDIYLQALADKREAYHAGLKNHMEESLGEDKERYDTLSTRKKEVEELLVSLNDELTQIDMDLPALQSKLDAAKEAAKKRFQDFTAAYTKIATEIETHRQIILPLINNNNNV